MGRSDACSDVAEKYCEVSRQVELGLIFLLDVRNLGALILWSRVLSEKVYLSVII